MRACKLLRPSRRTTLQFPSLPHSHPSTLVSSKVNSKPSSLNHQLSRQSPSPPRDLIFTPRRRAPPHVFGIHQGCFRPKRYRHFVSRTIQAQPHLRSLGHQRSALEPSASARLPSTPLQVESHTKASAETAILYREQRSHSIRAARQSENPKDQTARDPLLRSHSKFLRRTQVSRQV
jgi:hypothetical protein